MSKPRTTVVNYDASGTQAVLGAKANNALRQASGQAFTSMGTSNLINQQALQKVNEGVGLLGMYLQDRNASLSNQVPIDQKFLSGTNSITKKYADKAGGLFT
jgi:hypothetical protein